MSAGCLEAVPEVLIILFSQYRRERVKSQKVMIALLRIRFVARGKLYALLAVMCLNGLLFSRRYSSYRIDCRFHIPILQRGAVRVIPVPRAVKAHL